MASPELFTQQSVRQSFWRWHTAAWLTYIVAENLLFLLGDWGYSEGTVRVTLIRSFTTFPFAIALFYINAHLIVERYQPRHDWLRLVLATMGLLVGFAACRLILYRWGLEAMGVFDEFEVYRRYAILTNHFSLDTLWIGLQYLLFSYGYWFATHTIRLEREKRQLQMDLFASERSKLQAELGFLRNQLNPHFLFNTFNFLYAESLSCSPKLADSIMSLTVMMRSVAELGRDSLVPLSQELEYMRHYLKIQQYRFDERMNLIFTVTNEDFAPTIKVPPLLFISLIENVFKYGDLSTADDPAQLTFQLEDGLVQFVCRNRKKDLAGRKELSTGIGLANIRQQLQQQYPATHQLTINDTSAHFSLELTIGTTQPVAHLT
ncbi:sensor histidine kinase [soil metagenome]